MGSAEDSAIHVIKMTCGDACEAHPHIFTSPVTIRFLHSSREEQLHDSSWLGAASS